MQYRTWFCVTFLASACLNVFGNPTLMGSAQSLLQPGATSGKVKTIAPSQFGSVTDGSGIGKTVNGVNIFTGQPAYSIPLGGVSARTVSYPVVLTYSGGTKRILENDNEKAPVSWVGLGFNLGTPYIAVNHKGTVSSSDDAIFCDLGFYGNGQILANDSGTRYFLSSNPYVKIDYDTGTSGEYSGQFLKWVFTFPDGKKMLFGQDANAQRYQIYNKGVVRASPYASSAPKFIYRWDLRAYYDTIPNHQSRNKIVFEYAPILDSAAPGKLYVRESHIKNIKWIEGDQEIERYEFKTTEKNSNQYEGYAANEPRFAQKLFETQMLDSLKCFKVGLLTHFYKFRYALPPGKKNLLSDIDPFYPKFTGSGFVQDSGWSFTYKNSSYFYLLESITAPNSRKDSYSYESFNFTGSDGAGDPNVYAMKKASDGSEVGFSSSSLMNGWKIQNTCDERFCYSLAKGWDGSHMKLHVEIKRNLGNFFDPRTADSSSNPAESITSRIEYTVNQSYTKWDWELIPAGDYFLLANLNDGSVYTYEFDGTKWEPKKPFAGDSRVSDTAGYGWFMDTIKVAVAPKYFVVFKKGGSNHEAIVAFRHDTGWTSLNRNTSSCNFNNKAAYGESIRNTGNATCLQWARASQSLHATPNYFLVLDSLTNVFNAYALKKDHSGFEEVSSKFGFASTPSGLQLASYPMNWQKQITAVAATRDYVAIASWNGVGQGLSVSINVFLFDGDTLMSIGENNAPGTSFSNTQIFASEEYFLVSSQNVVWFWQMKTNSDGTLNFHRVDSVRQVPFPTYPYPPWLVKVETHRNAFALEYYPEWPANPESYGYRPKHLASGNYAVYLFQVGRQFQNGFVERTSDLLDGTVKPFGISFSQSDNMLTFQSGINGSGALCAQDVDDNNCIIRYYTAKTHPNLTGFFANDLRPVDTLSLGSLLKQPHRALSNASRIGTILSLDTAARKIRYSHLQFGGRGFIKPDSQYVVSEFSSSAALEDSDKNKVRYSFQYNPSNAGIVEFNSNVQLPQFEVVDVRQVNSNPSATSPNWKRFFFHLDSRGSPLNGKTMFLNGAEKNTREIRGAWDTVTSVVKTEKPYRRSSWPKSLYVHRPSAIFSKVSAKNTSWMADTSRYYNYCDTNGAPRFTLNHSRPQKILLGQRIFDSLGMSTQAISYQLPTFPDTDFIKVWDPTRPYSNTGAIGASKTLFNGYQLSEDSVWLEADQTLTDAQLRSGTSPTFKLDEGWQPGGKITRHDTANFFQVVESKRVRNKLSGAGGESYSSFFYEGLRSDPVATVEDSKLENCAILMGENGNANLTSGALDYRGRWENVGVTFTSANSYAHTGRYSLKVTNNYGPSLNLYLKDVRELGFGFRVSAWIYSDAGDPKMVVERRTSGGSLVDTIMGRPISGGYTTRRKWQRWEARVTPSQLVSGNLFNGNNDYLRIWIGTGTPAGGSNRIVYVDDIVCAPDIADFSMNTFDHRGLLTSSTTSNHLTTYFDRGIKGNVIGTRDSDFRLLGQAASHKMGEN